MNLEEEKLNILKLDEEIWNLKNRVTWLKAGDKNNNFFHNFLEHRRNVNSIWEFKNGNGELVSDHGDLQQLACSHFKNLYKALGNFLVRGYVNVIKE